MRTSVHCRTNSSGNTHAIARRSGRERAAVAFERFHFGVHIGVFIEGPNPHVLAPALQAPAIALIASARSNDRRASARDDTSRPAGRAGDFRIPRRKRALAHDHRPVIHPRAQIPRSAQVAWNQRTADSATRDGGRSWITPGSGRSPGSAGVTVSPDTGGAPSSRLVAIGPYATQIPGTATFLKTWGAATESSG
jgi:hypothetical protein